jgi:hypothetical protein
MVKSLRGIVLTVGLTLVAAATTFSWYVNKAEDIAARYNRFSQVMRRVQADPRTRSHRSDDGKTYHWLDVRKDYDFLDTPLGYRSEHEDGVTFVDADPQGVSPGDRLTTKVWLRHVDANGEQVPLDDNTESIYLTSGLEVVANDSWGHELAGRAQIRTLSFSWPNYTDPLAFADKLLMGTSD